MAGIGKVMGTKFFRDWKDLNDNLGESSGKERGQESRDEQGK